MQKIRLIENFEYSFKPLLSIRRCEKGFFVLKKGGPNILENL